MCPIITEECDDGNMDDFFVDLTPQTDGSDCQGAGRWGISEKRCLLSILKGCKYYEDFMCVTAEGTRNQISA